MADCEVCGASDANTRRVRMHGALLDACSACQSRLGLTIDEIKDANKFREQFNSHLRAEEGVGILGVHSMEWICYQKQMLN